MGRKFTDHRIDWQILFHGLFIQLDAGEWIVGVCDLYVERVARNNAVFVSYPQTYL